MQKGSDKLLFFSFDPRDFIDVFLMSNEDAGIRFKELITRLTKNDAPEGTIEYEMMERQKEFRMKQREKIMKRWHPESVSAPPAPPAPPAATSAPYLPPKRRLKPPTKEELYDLCDEEKLPLDYAREWYDWMESKGWNGIKSTWQGSLRGFCQKKLKNNH